MAQWYAKLNVVQLKKCPHSLPTGKLPEMSEDTTIYICPALGSDMTCFMVLANSGHFPQEQYSLIKPLKCKHIWVAIVLIF